LEPIQKGGIGGAVAFWIRRDHDVVGVVGIDQGHTCTSFTNQRRVTSVDRGRSVIQDT